MNSQVYTKSALGIATTSLQQSEEGPDLGRVAWATTHGLILAFHIRN